MELTEQYMFTRCNGALPCTYTGGGTDFEKACDELAAARRVLLETTIVFTKDNLQSSHAATEPAPAPTTPSSMGVGMTSRRLARSWVAAPTMLLDTTIVFTKEHLQSSRAATAPARAPTLEAELTSRRLARSWVAAPTMLLETTIVFTKDNLQSSHAATESARAPTLEAEVTLRRLAMSWMAAPTMLLDKTTASAKESWE